MSPANASRESDASMRARLVESLSNSFPGSALSLALQAMTRDDPPAADDDDPLSRSCFAELRLERGGRSDDEDDEEEEEEDGGEACGDDDLTSLAWLQEGNLLKSMSSDDAFAAIDVAKENAAGGVGGAGGAAHPPHIPYNPQKHVNSKPPYSFSCLIFMAIEDAPLKRLPVKEIYGWMVTRFPYFENAPTGWKNSVRHNLSLNKCFKKVDKDKASSIGKGSLWMIDPDFRPNLLQALRKTPYHPFHQLQMMSNTPNSGFSGLPSNAQVFPWSSQNNVNRPMPHLFPFLSKRLAQSKSDTESDIDVANTLMSLKRSAESRRPLRCHNGWAGRGARSRSPSPPEFGSEREKRLLKERHKLLLEKASVVCTDPPTADHSYSLTAAVLRDSSRSPTSSIDAEYEFGGGDSPPTDRRRIDGDDAESCSDCSDYDESDGADVTVAAAVSPARHSLRVTLPALTRPRGGGAWVAVKRRRVSDEEQVKIEEGADALLNLAGICAASVPLQALSPDGGGGGGLPPPLAAVKTET